MPYRSSLGPTMEDEAPQRRPRLIICSNVLPVILTKNEQTGIWSAEFDTKSLFEDGPMYVGLRNVDPNTQVLYIGVPRAFIPDGDRGQVTTLLANMGCYPVYCDPVRAHNHFQGYCKGILWPTFHNVIDLYARAGKGSKVFEDSTQPDPEHQSSSKPDQNWAPARSWSPMEAEACWPDYCAMQGLFSRKAVEIYSEGDTLWVHDYHLLVLPSYLIRRIPNAKIGLFLHVPFPSSEIFRTLATREEILRAMLCADHIGFDLYEYARHFLTACNRMLGLKYEPKKGGVLVLHNHGREISITCSHIGSHSSFVHRELESHEMQAMARRVALSQQTAGPIGGSMERRQMILGIDEVEGLRGLGLKLLAFDRLFRDYPYLRDRVFLRQIGLRLDSRPDDYNQCHDEVLGLIAHMQQKWGKHSVEYEERDSIDLAERLAIMQNADVYLNTSVRVGIDMLPFEYLMARRNPAGCVILSEFSACSRVLHGSLRVNPFKTSALAATIEEALSMSVAERTARCARDLEHIERNTLQAWASRMLEDINDAHNDTREPVTKFGGGFGTRLLIRANEVHKQQELDHVEFCESFKSSKRRIIILDYSGTLVETTSMNMYMKRGGTARTWHYENGGSRRPGGCLETRDPISDTTRGRLIDLCRNRSNVVVVMSSDLRDELAHALEGIPNLALIAENGFVFRAHPGARWVSAVDEEASGGGDWYGGNSTSGFYAAETEHRSTTSSAGGSGSAHTDTDSIGGDSSDAASLPDGAQHEIHGWQESIRNIMNKYSNRTNGSFVWESPSAVSFNYVLSDPDLGSLQASNLQLELEQVTISMPLTVESGKGAVTVRLRGVNRGTAVRELLAYLEMHPFTESDYSPDPKHADAHKSIDFLACFGDDNEDERAFSAVNKYRGQKTSHVTSYSVRVASSAHSKAKYFVHDTEEVTEILGALVEASTTHKIRRNFSQGGFGAENRNESSIMGNFRTKQSYVTLSQHAENVANNVPRVDSVKPRATLPHTMSYVASSAELADMFQGQDTMLSSTPSPATIPPSASAGPPMDPRHIPPTSPARELDTDMDDDDFANEDDAESDFGGDIGQDHGYTFGDDDDDDDAANGGPSGGYKKDLNRSTDDEGDNEHTDDDDDEGRYGQDNRVVRESSNGELVVVEDGKRRLNSGSRMASSNGSRYSTDTLDSAFHKVIFAPEEASEVPANKRPQSVKSTPSRRPKGESQDERNRLDGHDFTNENIKLLLAGLAGASFTYVFLKSR